MDNLLRLKLNSLLLLLQVLFGVAELKLLPVSSGLTASRISVARRVPCRVYLKKVLLLLLLLIDVVGHLTTVTSALRPIVLMLGSPKHGRLSGWLLGDPDEVKVQLIALILLFNQPLLLLRLHVLVNH
jgi:hypothetical protein